MMEPLLDGATLASVMLLARLGRRRAFGAAMLLGWPSTVKFWALVSLEVLGVELLLQRRLREGAVAGLAWMAGVLAVLAPQS